MFTTYGALNLRLEYAPLIESRNEPSFLQRDVIHSAECVRQSRLNITKKGEHGGL